MHLTTLSCRVGRVLCRNRAKRCAREPVSVVPFPCKNSRYMITLSRISSKGGKQPNSQRSQTRVRDSEQPAVAAAEYHQVSPIEVINWPMLSLMQRLEANINANQNADACNEIECELYPISRWDRQEQIMNIRSFHPPHLPPSPPSCTEQNYRQPLSVFEVCGFMFDVLIMSNVSSLYTRTACNLQWHEYDSM
jgi:hypothetical protein